MLGVLNKFAIYYPYSTNNYQVTTSSHSSLPLGMLLVILLVSTVVLVVVLASYWKVFIKAGRPGWASIIPFYNLWVIAEIGGKPGWWGLFWLLSFIPIIGGLVSLVIYAVICVGVAERFGKSAVFGVFGLAIFSVIGYPLLAFGPAQYKGGDALAAGGSSDPAYPSVPSNQTGQQQNASPASTVVDTPAVSALPTQPVADTPVVTPAAVPSVDAESADESDQPNPPAAPKAV